MFEDFKEKVGKLQTRNDNEITLMPMALAFKTTEKIRNAGFVGLLKYNETTFNVTAMHFYKKPKKFSNL